MVHRRTGLKQCLNRRGCGERGEKQNLEKRPDACASMQIHCCNSWERNRAALNVALVIVFFSHAPEPVVRGEEITVAPAANDGTLLNRRVTSFRVQNAPINMIVYGLGCLGIRICLEDMPQPAAVEGMTYVDPDGHLVFTGPVYSLEARDISLREFLDRLVQVAPDFTWQAVPGTELINVFPKRDSCLSFQVPPFKASGTIDEVLTKTPSLQKTLASRLIHRGPPLPVVDLMFAGGTGRDVLNEIVRHQPVMVWSAAGKGTGPGPGGTANAGALSFTSALGGPSLLVDLVYDVKRGEPIRTRGITERFTTNRTS